MDFQISRSSEALWTSAAILLSKYSCSPANQISPRDSNISRVALPALTQVRGAFKIETSGQFNCSAFQKLSSSKAIRGKFDCKGNQQKLGTADPSSSNSGGKTGAAIHFEVSIPRILCGSSVIATFLQFFL